jgi:RNA polymerase sigma-70 factor (ECF subfamily)
MEEMAEPDSHSGVFSRENDTEPAELLARIRDGDPAAFEAVAREYAPRLFRLALRLTGRREEAEDLVQETLVRALPALRRFEGRSKLWTYLARALGNLWKNRLRSRKRSRLVAWFRGRGDRDAADEATFDPADTAPSALDRLEQADRAAEIRRAVAELEPQRRWTLLLREVEEMSYEEIAEATDVPVGTVRSRLARARDDLRHLLEGRV